MKRVLAVIVAAAAVVGCTPSHPRQPMPSKPTPVQPPAPVTPAPPPPATRQTAEPVTPLPATRPAAVTQQPAVQPQPAIPAPPPIPSAPPLAVVDGVQIPRDRVERLVMDAHGLNMLLRVVQVELARADAAKEHLQVTADDVAAERASTLEKMFKDASPKLTDQIADAENKNDQALVAKLREELRKDNEAMLQQTLARQNTTAVEFDLLMEANTYMRRIIEKQTEGKITEQNVKDAFNAFYGENVRVRHIQCANMAEITGAQQRLAQGESFESVARDVSRNAQTRALGGELPPFSRQTPGLPDMFKQVAFSLKNAGDIADPVEANGSYHLIKLIEHIAPKAVKYEDMKDHVRDQLRERWVIERMKVYREELAKRALDSLKIVDPVLAKQFADRLARRDTELKERDQISRELSRERERAQQQAAEAATQPAPEPATSSVQESPETTGAEQPAAPASPATTATEPTAPQGELRPPATQSGSDTPDQTTTQP